MKNKTHYLYKYDNSLSYIKRVQVVAKNNMIYECSYAGEYFKCGYCRRGNIIVPNFKGIVSGCRVCHATIHRVITDKWEVTEKNGKIIRKLLLIPTSLRGA